jgi:hypothetical protein
MVVGVEKGRWGAEEIAELGRGRWEVVVDGTYGTHETYGLELVGAIGN